MMIVSIGIALAARHVFLFRVGGGYVQYGQYTLQRDPISIGPIDYAPRSLWIMGMSLAVIVGVALFLLRARFGKAIRAVSDNPDLASSSGIDSDRVILIVWILSGALAGLGGVFYGLEYGIRWDMGFTLLLLMFAAITLGGLGNPFGALVGSLIIGLAVEMWTFIVPNANDMKNVGCAGRPDHHPARSARRAFSAARNGSDELGTDLLERPVRGRSTPAAAAYCMVSTGLNVHVGYTGLLNFGQAGFAALGAYAFAIPIVKYGWPWYWSLLARVRRVDPPRPAARHPDVAPARRLPGDRHHRRGGDHPLRPRQHTVHVAHRRHRWPPGLDLIVPGPQPVAQRRPLSSSVPRCSPDTRCS